MDRGAWQTTVHKFIELDITEVTTQCLAKGAVVFRKSATGTITVKSQRY